MFRNLKRSPVCYLQPQQSLCADSLPIVPLAHLNFPWLWVADLVFCKSAHAYLVIYSEWLFYFFFLLILLIAKRTGNFFFKFQSCFFVRISFFLSPSFSVVLLCRLERIMVWYLNPWGLAEKTSFCSWFCFLNNNNNLICELLRSLKY